MSDDWVPIGALAQKIISNLEGRGNTMAEKIDLEADDGKQFKVRLNSYDRAALARMKAHYGTSWSGAIRACIRGAALQIGFRMPASSTKAE